MGGTGVQRSNGALVGKFRFACSTRGLDPGYRLAAGGNLKQRWPGEGAERLGLPARLKPSSHSEVCVGVTPQPIRY
jgi:hypothetical protein